MKNKIFNILIFSAMSLFTMACSEGNGTPENVGGDSTIALSVQSVTFLNDGSPAEGSAASVTVESSGEWRLIGKDTWCHPSVTSGKSGDAVIFTADANAGSGEIRTEEFSFVCGSRTEKLYVVQKEDDVITFFKDRYEVGRNGYRIGVNISSNQPVTWSVPDDFKGWISHVENMDATTTDVYVFYFDIAATDQYNVREGRISFTAGGTTKDITISQDKNLLLRTTGSSSSYILEQGTPVEIIVETNVAYTMSFSSGSRPSWLTCQNDADAGTAPDDVTKRTITVSANVAPETSSKAEQITLTSADGSLSASFAVIQRGTNPITINIPDENFRQALADAGFVVAIGYEAPECEITELGRTSNTLDVSGKGIQSLEGLNHFSRVENLDCSNNNITRADFTGTYVYSASGRVGTNLSGNPWKEIVCTSYIRYLDFRSSSPDVCFTGSNGDVSKSLKITGATQLQYFYISNNPSLTILDVSGCSFPYMSYGNYYFSIQGAVPDGLMQLYLPTGTSSTAEALCSGVEIHEGPSNL